MIREDEELRAWMDDWRAEEPGALEPGSRQDDSEAVAAIVRRVKRRTLGLRLLAAGEVTLVACALTALTLFALRSRHPLDVAAMAGLGLLSIAAAAFGFWNRRGLWGPADETTAAYLALTLARCRRRLTGLRAGRWLLAAETAIFIPWIWHRLHQGAGSPGPALCAMAYGYLALVAGVALALVLWLERWSRRELAGLEEALTPGPSPSLTSPQPGEGRKPNREEGTAT